MRTRQLALVAVSVLIALFALIVSHTASGDSPATLYDDEFDTAQLNTRWSWIREDASHWSLTAAPGSLRIITQYGDLYQGNNNLRNLLLQPMPTGDFDVTTKLKIDPVAEYHQGGVILYQDQDNYLKLVRAYDSPWGGADIVFALEKGGSFDHSFHQAVPRSVGSLYLKVSRRGTWYQGSFSTDGTTWTALGEYSQVNLVSPRFGLMAANGYVTSTPEISADFDFFRVRLDCETPFFWQRDPLWADHPLRSNGQCSSDYDTIGEGGCTLTSAAMVFRHLGARFSTFIPMDPPNLSDCMGTSACPFSWTAGSACTNDKASIPRVYAFTWSRLDQEINQNHRPVILGMHLKGNLDDTHWVVVTRGQGSDPANYYMYDPWYKCGQNMKLSHRSGRYDFNWIAVYQGEATCGFSSAAPLCEQTAAPVPVPTMAATDTGWFDRQTQRELFLRENPSDASALSGSVLLYRATEITMTVELSATSSVGNVAEMLIWSDTLANTTWQAFSPLAWLPLSDSVYVRFRNQFGDVSETYSDTTIPAAPIAMPDPERVYLPLIRK